MTTHIRAHYSERGIPPRLPCHSEYAYAALVAHVEEALPFREISRKLGLAPGQGRRLVMQAVERFERHERGLAEQGECARCKQARMGHRLYLSGALADRLDLAAARLGFGEELAPTRWVLAIDRLLDQLEPTP